MTASRVDAELDPAWTATRVAGHARTVVVPVANPDTLVDMLRVAHALLPTEGGRILATAIEVSEADAERQQPTMEGLQDLVDALRSRMPNTAIELRSRAAVSVTRGVLDAVRDNGADALVVGVHSNVAGDVELGGIAETLIEAAPCDVVVVRSVPDSDLSAVQRVVVGVDGSTVSRTAVRAGVLLGEELRRPVDLVHVYRSGTRRAAAREVVRRSALDVDGAGECQWDLLRSDDVVTAMAQHLRPDDLLVVGFGDGSDSLGWSAGSTVRGVIETVDLPVVGVARHDPAPSGASERLRRVRAWLHPRLTMPEQASVRSNAEAAAGVTLDYVLMTLLSSAIATFGILLDSSAVIIGAMLVAPLMGPLQAFGAGLVAGRTRVAAQAALTTLYGVVLALAFSALVGQLLGPAEPTAEMLSRGSPTIIDAGVAIAAGAAGAYATARKGIPAALAGVAIAAALVPPISVTGLGFAIGRPALAAGAGLLFAVNMVFIAAVSAGVFAWLGLRPSDRDRPDEAHHRWWMGLAVLGVLLTAAIVVLQAGRATIDRTALEDALMQVVDGVQLVEAERARGVADPTVRVVVEAPTTSAGIVGDRPGTTVDPEVQEDLARAARAELARQLGDGVHVRLSVHLVREL